MRKYFLLLMMAALFLPFLPAQAVESSRFVYNGITLSAEPIVGYAFDHSDTPNPHVRGTLIYGARVTGGMGNLALEAEYTRGSVSEVFVNQTIKTEQENIKIGIRGSKSLLSILSASARVGGQGSAEKIEDSVNGNSAPAWVVRPYAGVGLEGKMGNQFSLSADATYIFNDLQNLSKNDIQTTLSFNIFFRPN
jgi:hypothetical protein